MRDVNVSPVRRHRDSVRRGRERRRRLRERRRIDGPQHACPISDVEPRAIRAQREPHQGVPASRQRDALNDCKRGGVDDVDVVAGLIADVDARAVGADREAERRCAHAHCRDRRAGGDARRVEHGQRVTILGDDVDARTVRAHGHGERPAADVDRGAERVGRRIDHGERIEVRIRDVDARVVRADGQSVHVPEGHRRDHAVGHRVDDRHAGVVTGDIDARAGVVHGGAPGFDADGDRGDHALRGGIDHRHVAASGIRHVGVHVESGVGEARHAGGVERLVIDRDLVDQALEIARADAKRTGPSAVFGSYREETRPQHGGDRPGMGRLGAKAPIDVKLETRAIVDARDVVPDAASHHGATAGGVGRVHERSAAIGAHEEIHARTAGAATGGDLDAIEVRRHETLTAPRHRVVGRRLHEEFDGEPTADVEIGRPWDLD